MASAATALFDDRVPVYEIHPNTVASWRAHVLRATDYVVVPDWMIVAGGSVFFLVFGMLLGGAFHI